MKTKIVMGVLVLMVALLLGCSNKGAELKKEMDKCYAQENVLMEEETKLFAEADRARTINTYDSSGRYIVKSEENPAYKGMLVAACRKRVEMLQLNDKCGKLQTEWVRAIGKLGPETTQSNVPPPRTGGDVCSQVGINTEPLGDAP